MNTQHRSSGDSLLCCSLAADWACMCEKVSCLQIAFPNGFSILFAMVFKLSLLQFSLYLSSVMLHMQLYFTS